MKILNYSVLKEKDFTIYNVFGVSIPGGLSIKFILYAVINEVFFNLIGFFVSKNLGIKYFDFENSSFMFGILMIVLPFLLAVGENKIMIQGYSIPNYFFNYILYIIKKKNMSLDEESDDVNEKEKFYIDGNL